MNKTKPDSYQRVKILNTPKNPKALIEVTKKYSILDIAATGQKLVEDYALKIVKNILHKTKKEKELFVAEGFFKISLLINVY